MIYTNSSNSINLSLSLSLYIYIYLFLPIRLFWTCPIRKCSFFAWADTKFPLCNHQQKSILRRVLKPGENNSKFFFCCGKEPSMQCKFFEWVTGHSDYLACHQFENDSKRPRTNEYSSSSVAAAATASSSAAAAAAAATAASYQSNEYSSVFKSTSLSSSSCSSISSSTIISSNSYGNSKPIRFKPIPSSISIPL